MWVTCCHFQELFCSTANAPFLPQSCAIIWSTTGKVAWSSLWPYETHLNMKIDLSWMAFISKQPPHTVDAHAEGGWVMTRSHQMMSWSFCLLPPTLPSPLCCYTSTLMLLNLCRPASANLIVGSSCLIWKFSHLEHKPERSRENVLQVSGKSPADSPCQMNLGQMLDEFGACFCCDFQQLKSRDANTLWTFNVSGLITA